MPSVIQQVAAGDLSTSYTRREKLRQTLISTPPDGTFVSDTMFDSLHVAVEEMVEQSYVRGKQMAERLLRLRLGLGTKDD